MQKSNEDCFYFITSTCAKGSACSYRHNPTVLTCNVICPQWSRGNCPDPACPFRHSAIQSPVMSNGIKCFYENSPTGCLKPDCTFFHTRSRLNLRNSPSPRPSTTNLVNKDVIKSSPVINPTPPPPTSTINEPVPPPVPAKVEPLPPPVQEKPPTPPPPTIIETTDRNHINEPSDDTNTSSRVVVNRNVVISEPSRKVVQTTTSNRVVVSSKRPANDSDSDLDDLIEQENDAKKTNTAIDISFPCSAPSITNRLFTTSKPSTPTNDTKPIRLKRDVLPAAKISAPKPIIPPQTNGEKTSAGTGLSQDDERRTSRLERFKKKPVSPPRTVVNTNSISTRNVINSSPNERKRPAPEQITNDSPPSKRLSSQQEHNSTTIGDLCSPPTSPRRSHTRHHRRRRSSPSLSPSPSPPPLRKSPLRQTYSATPTMNESAWKRQVDEFLAKTTQPRPQVIPKPVPLLSLRPRYVPPPAPQPLMPPQQSAPVRIKRPAPSVTTPAAVPTKPVEPTPPPAPAQQPNNSKDKDDDENRLLGLDEPTDVVDTFALIDEVLLETDDLFELT